MPSNDNDTEALFNIDNIDELTKERLINYPIPVIKNNFRKFNFTLDMPSDSGVEKIGKLEGYFASLAITTGKAAQGIRDFEAALNGIKPKPIAKKPITGKPITGKKQDKGWWAKTKDVTSKVASTLAYLMLPHIILTAIGVAKDAAKDTAGVVKDLFSSSDVMSVKFSRIVQLKTMSKLAHEITLLSNALNKNPNFPKQLKDSIDQLERLDNIKIDGPIIRNEYTVNIPKELLPSISKMIELAGEDIEFGIEGLEFDWIGNLVENLDKVDDKSIAKMNQLSGSLKNLMTTIAGDKKTKTVGLNEDLKILINQLTGDKGLVNAITGPNGVVHALTGKEGSLKEALTGKDSIKEALIGDDSVKSALKDLGKDIDANNPLAPMVQASKEIKKNIEALKAHIR